MSKTLKKKKHWLSKVQECAVSWAGAPGDLGAEIRGGAERGEFPYLGRLREDPGGGTCCVVSGKAPSPGDVLLEVNGTPVSGLTHRDTLAVIRHFREPIRLKTVKPERFTLYSSKNLRQAWNKLSYVNHAEDLASKLLQCSPKNRLSAQAALSHEYFSDLPPRLWELTDKEHLLKAIQQKHPSD